MAYVTDDDDEDLRRAIAMSLEDAQAAEVSSPPRKQSVDTSINGKVSPVHLKEPAPKPCDHAAVPIVTSKATTSTMSLLGLDRKAMEQERLARRAALKREAPISPPRLQREQNQANKKAKTAPPVSIGSLAAFSDSGTGVHGPSFPHGIVKKTWSAGCERENDIKIEEVLNKDHLKTAVFSSFMWDIDWLLSKVDSTKTKMCLIMEAKDDRTKAQYAQDVKEQGLKNIRLCFPPVQGPYCKMHSKLMLLFYAEYLRIVVPTANLMPYDWGEAAVMENSVFLVDLPRCKEGDSRTNAELTFFGQELMYFLEKMGLDERVLQGVLNFDFSNTKHLAFIHSAFGSHFEEDIYRTGFPGLSRAVRHLGLECPGAFELHYASSSIGSLNDLTLNSLYEAARGSNVANQSREKLKSPNSNAKSGFMVYFPTDETVKQSRGGPDSAGTICLQQKYYNKTDFPRAIFREYQSKRQGVLSHNKLLFARGTKSADGKDALAWLYVGSANLSDSAWGRLVTDRSRKVSKLTCNNWECGVLVSVGALDSNALNDSLDKVFRDVIDVPFEFPGKDYGVQKPWFFM